MVGLPVELSAFQRGLVQAAFPQAHVLDAQYFRREFLPSPIRVSLSTPQRGLEVAVVRVTRHGDAAREAQVLQALLAAGLPVPRVLAGPAVDPLTGRAATVLSLLPGQTLQSLAERSPEDLRTARRLLIEAVTAMAGATAALRRDSVAASLPTRTLLAELEDFRATPNPWADHRLVAHALRELERVLPAIDVPLAFTSGDYQPANFLADGGRLSGLVDFELASFRDPVLGFAKYPIYDLRPLSRAGVIEEFLASRGLAVRDFAPRLALECLSTLKREVAAGGAGVARYRDHVLGLLGQALQQMRP